MKHYTKSPAIKSTVIILFAILFLFSGSRVVIAQETTIHVVAWGETLYSIARRYDVTVDEIVDANGLSGTNIYAGQRLTIPGDTPSSTVANGEASSSSTHVVQQGETLYRIGLKYGMSYSELAAANGLSNANQVYVGQVLIIPSGEAQSENVPENQETSPETEAETPVEGVHIVVQGETLYSISRKYNVSVAALADTNNLINPAHIYVGQQLTLPGAPTAVTIGYTPDEVTSTHVVARGETLTSIGSRYGVSPWVLAQVNNISNPALLYAGQILTIPTEDALADGGTVETNKRIVVDVSEQRTYVYEGDELLWTYVVSTGLPGTDTWRGEFKILTKLPNAYAETWDLQMPYWLGFYWAGPLQNGFHALPILSNGVRLWEGLLGTPASYGCVILSDADAQQLYNWAEIGTPVTVRN
ncbi:MAG: LysM peptidoglycan-binding domain-containing protein [Anaerolineae bacterium]|nr:LysM peptidoglycan-binding domain-containing protein [Anaerolineae bacterium]